jgi:dUTP pyrophosphatase
MNIEVVASEGAIIPEYATEGAAGFDLRVHNFKLVYSGKEAQKAEDFMNADGQLVLEPGRRALVGTGLFVAVPEGYELQVRPRSGLALKEGITVLNSPGTIDSDYRGEIGVILINHSTDVLFISLGDRVAQGVVTSYTRIKLVTVDKLSDTERGEGGFGHTGK